MVKRSTLEIIEPGRLAGLVRAGWFKCHLPICGIITDNVFGVCNLLVSGRLVTLRSLLAWDGFDPQSLGKQFGTELPSRK